jgi:hypothetical protein
VGHPDSLRREAHNGRSQAVAPNNLGNSRIQRSTATNPQRSGDVARAPDSEQCMSIVHRTIRCARRQNAAAFYPMARSVGEPINTPTGHFNMWEPKEHTKA